MDESGEQSERGRKGWMDRFLAALKRQKTKPIDTPLISFPESVRCKSPLMGSHQRKICCLRRKSGSERTTPDERGRSRLDRDQGLDPWRKREKEYLLSFSVLDRPARASGVFLGRMFPIRPSVHLYL